MNDLQLYVLAPQKETLLSLFLDFVIAFFDWFVWFATTFGTLLSVFVAVGLYLWKVNQDKRNAARILLMEIRNAEKTITDIKNFGTVAPTTFLMPTASWAKSQHYFIEDFNIDELNLFNDFYNLCNLAQIEVDRLKNRWPISNEEKIKVTQQLFGTLAHDFSDPDISFDDNTEYKKKRDAIIHILNKETGGFQPELPIINLNSYLPNLRFITTTTCGNKLKKIANLD